MVKKGDDGMMMMMMIPLGWVVVIVGTIVSALYQSGGCDDQMLGDILAHDDALSRYSE